MTSARQCQLIYVDPGVTTGLFVVTVRPQWVCADTGDGSWESLKRATVRTWHGEIGRHGRTWDERTGHSAKTPDPLGYGAAYVVRAKRGGRGAAGSDELDTDTADELTQAVQIAELLDQWPDAAWGIEDFRLRVLDSNKELLAPVRMIARVETLEILHGERGRVPFKQMPGEKDTASDDRLQRAGWYRPAMGHANDAARHAAVFLRKCRESAQLRHEAFPRVFTDYKPTPPKERVIA